MSMIGGRVDDDKAMRPLSHATRLADIDWRHGKLLPWSPVVVDRRGER